MQPNHQSAIWMQILGQKLAADRPQTQGEVHLEAILATVNHRPLRHYVQGLWNRPSVLARITSGANELSLAAQLWLAVRLVRDNPTVQPGERDLAVVVTVLMGMRTLVYPSCMPKSPLPQKEKVLVRQALTQCAFASIRTLGIQDRRCQRAVQLSILFQTRKQDVAMSAEELELHSRLMTICFLAWMNCHAKQAIQNVRP